MIKQAGERIFPLEIEAIIDSHPQVQESAVVGIPDRILGEAVMALVVKRRADSLEPGSVRQHCLSELPFARAPRKIQFVESIPKTSTGKIDRREIQRLVQDGLLPVVSTGDGEA